MSVSIPQRKYIYLTKSSICEKEGVDWGRVFCVQDQIDYEEIAGEKDPEKEL